MRTDVRVARGFGVALDSLFLVGGAVLAADAFVGQGPGVYQGAAQATVGAEEHQDASEAAETPEPDETAEAADVDEAEESDGPEETGGAEDVDEHDGTSGPGDDSSPGTDDDGDHEGSDD